MDDSIDSICKEFEEKSGSILFLKLCGSVVNRILVDKGIVTEEELKGYLQKELKEYLKIHNL